LAGSILDRWCPVRRGIHSERQADEAAVGTEAACLITARSEKMKLSSKLETLLVIGVKTAGSYDPMNALGTVEEQMTPQEVATATKFLTWIVANKLAFGRGNIRERFQQFEAAH